MMNWERVKIDVAACSNQVIGSRVEAGSFLPAFISGQIEMQAVETNGYFVPLRKNFGVMLGPAPYKKRLKWFDESWHIDIPTYKAPAEFTDEINFVTWHAARQEIYGSNKEQLLEVKALADSVPQSIQAIAPRYEAAQLLGLDLQERMKDEMLWLKLLFGMTEPENKSEVMHLTV